jgi:AI-2 transport protein TqsA
MQTKLNLDATAKFFIVAIGVVAIVIALRELQYIFLPFVLAYFLYFMFAPVTERLRAWRVPMFVVILLEIAVTAAVFYAASKYVFDSALRLLDNVDVYVDKIDFMVRDLAASMNLDAPELRAFSVEDLLATLDYQALASGALSSTVDLTGYVLFVLFFFVFISSGHRGIYEAFKRRFVARVKMTAARVSTRIETTVDDDGGETESATETEETTREGAVFETTFRLVSQQIQKYVGAKFLLNLGAGATVYLILLALGVDFADVWGSMAFILNFIPTIGSAVALVAPAVMATLQSESIGFGLLVAALVGAVQTGFFNLLEPAIVGKRLDLNPIVLLLAVLLWGYVWGVVGMLLAAPLTAMARIVISNYQDANMRFLSDLMDDDD